MMLCKGTGTDLGNCKKGLNPRGLRKRKGELNPHGGKRERQSLGVGMQAGTVGEQGCFCGSKS